MAEPAEQRAEERFPANDESSCPFASPAAEDFGQAKIKDVSLAGIGLLTIRKVEPGALLAVTLANTPKRFTKTVLVRVTQVTPMSGRYLVGGVFTVPLTSQELTSLVM